MCPGEGQTSAGEREPDANAGPTTTTLLCFTTALGCREVSRRAMASLALEADVGLWPRPPETLWVTRGSLLHL